MSAIYRGMTRAQLDAAYDNSKGVANSSVLMADLDRRSAELRAAYRAEWLAEYTPYRLASALGRWDAEYEYWRQLQARLEAFSKSSHEGEPLPSLESVAIEK